VRFPGSTTNPLGSSVARGWNLFSTSLDAVLYPIDPIAMKVVSRSTSSVNNGAGCTSTSTSEKRSRLSIPALRRQTW
jgi:hypothetical protein